MGLKTKQIDRNGRKICGEARVGAADREMRGGSGENHQYALPKCGVSEMIKMSKNHLTSCYNIGSKG